MNKRRRRRIRRNNRKKIIVDEFKLSSLHYLVKMGWVSTSWLRKRILGELKMFIGNKVETTCEYSRVMHGKQLKGIIREISESDNNIIRVELPCGCFTWINKHWLRRVNCCCSCHY